MIDNRFMSVMETAQYLRIGRTKAYKLTKDPTFPIMKIGTKILVDKKILDEIWLPHKQATTLH